MHRSLSFENRLLDDCTGPGLKRDGFVTAKYWYDASLATKTSYFLFIGLLLGNLSLPKWNNPVLLCKYKIAKQALKGKN